MVAHLRQRVSMYANEQSLPAKSVIDSLKIPIGYDHCVPRIYTHMSGLW
jgi:hypothetical protein